MHNVKRYVVIKDKKILRDYHTAQGVEGIHSSIQTEGIECDEIKEVPISCKYSVNTDIREYDQNGKLRPLSVRVHEGLVVPPDGCVLDGENIRFMNMEEKVAAGIIQLDPHIKAVGDQFLLKTKEELIADGVKTAEQIMEEEAVEHEENLIQAEMRKIVIQRLGDKLKKVTS